ncbi:MULTISPECIES: hypothetical protein [unclassified Rathayibacter]|uniref:hypothetical protein n=1 Tax=unclassified Rathayibacter TaxID=2609250 RepID=UPI000CE815DD|nr:MULTISPECIES: hypothetical protein [unclassified Rathayibacter]PPF19465.1 hypothetical protein C5B92_03200 [Rathayibacter sp. AY1A4]PPF21289.1 hypothetical protein C5B95_05530 [Rathayibacter sp. AY1A7]PPF59689.1 hypothetical protein C5C55_01165 [Rathayibacter sp. AY1C2]PPG83920.1 hypothetical protein C5C52_01620 [Rathayibacter sp. AY1E5]PPH11835.1 hypothetical protein C5C71_05940 [Rathayibacter sp. AY1C1]
MTTLDHAAPAPHLDAPLLNDRELRERVSSLIGPAYRRALWPIFLDRDGVQLPILYPVDGLPVHPDEEKTERIVATLAKAVAHQDVGSLAFALERPGRAFLGETDRVLARHLAAACHKRAIPLRALLLVHDEGVRVVTATEYAAVAL